MTDLAHRLRVDRQVRDRAKALVKADLTHMRNDLSRRGVGTRVMDRVSEGAVDIFEQAVETADNHRGALATLLAAIGLWFARNPIMALFTDADEDEDGWSDDRFDNDDEYEPTRAQRKTRKDR